MAHSMARTKQAARAQPRPPPDPQRLTFGVRTSNKQMEHILRCTDSELSDLKSVVKMYMQRPDYDGEPLLGQNFQRFRQDKKQRVRDSLWARVARHNEVCRELLSGVRWRNTRKPNGWEGHLNIVKLKIMSLHQSAAALTRLAAEKRGHKVPLSESESSADSGRSDNVPPKRVTREENLKAWEVDDEDEDDEDEDMVVVRTPNDFKKAQHQPSEANNHVPSFTQQWPAGPSTGTDPATPISATPAQSASAFPAPGLRAPAEPTASATPNFNEQMMLLAVQNQQMMLKMMEEIQSLKKNQQ